MSNEGVPVVEKGPDTNLVEQQMVEGLIEILPLTQPERIADNQAEFVAGNPILAQYLFAKRRTEAARKVLTKHIDGY